MRGAARRGPSASFVMMLVVVFMAAGILGLATNWLSFLAPGGGGSPSQAVVGDDALSELAEAPWDALEESLRRCLPVRDVLANEDVRTSYRRATLPETAREVLAEYQAQGDCLLCEAGYLDLQGNVWACVVQGDGWVEVQVARSVDDGKASELSVIHMDAQVWAQELEGLGGEEL